MKKGFVVARNASRMFICCASLIVAWVGCGSRGTSQEASPTLNVPTITSTGSHEIAVVPTRLRLKMQMKAESRDPKDALLSLKDHQVKVRKALEAMKADVPSIEMSIASLTTGIPGVDDPEQARRIVRQQAAQVRNLNPQMRGQLANFDDEDSELPVIYTATSTLKVEWVLPKELDDDAIVLPSLLMSQIESKDFRGRKLREELSGEEQALIQPLLGASPYYANNGRPADLQLVFIGPIDEKTERNALKSAFEDAQARAMRIAEAAGGKLGALRTASAPTVISPNGQQYNYVYSSNGSVTMMPIESSAKEIVSADPSNMKRQINVNVTYELKKN